MKRDQATLGSLARAGLTTVTLVAVALAGCGATDDKKEAELGYGLVVEVPANLKGKGLVIEAIRTVYADELDLVPEVEECVLKRLQQVPEAEFDSLVDGTLDRARDDQLRAALAFANQHTADCIQSGDNVVESDANALTVRVLRAGLIGTMTALLDKELLLTERQKSCFIDQYRNLTDPELIQLVNSTFTQQRQFGAKAGRNCASA